MFKTFQSHETKTLNHSGRSHVGETLQVEGNIRSSGSLDVSGLINGNVFVSDMTVNETGSIRGILEATVIHVWLMWEIEQGWKLSVPFRISAYIRVLPHTWNVRV